MTSRINATDWKWYKIRNELNEVTTRRKKKEERNSKVWNVIKVSDLRGACVGLAGCRISELAECMARRRILCGTGRRGDASSVKLPSLSVSRSLPVKSTELYSINLRAAAFPCDVGLALAKKLITVFLLEWRPLSLKLLRLMQPTTLAVFELLLLLKIC